MGAGEPPPASGGNDDDLRTLDRLWDGDDALTVAERESVVDQALVLVEQLYVHLPLKRAMYAVDPVQRLRLLRHRLAHRSARWFHEEMVAIFGQLQDLHTAYGLPAPFHDRVAYLPFRVEEHYVDGERRYAASEVSEAAGDFRRGVTITHLSGVPIDRAVQLNAQRHRGSNPDARRARGLTTLTVRPLQYMLPPDEEWVIVGYEANGEAREIRFPWRVRGVAKTPSAVDPNRGDELALLLGIDAEAAIVRRTMKSLFAPDAMALEEALQTGATDVAEEPVSTLPDLLQFRSVETSHGTFGYLRIRSFESRPEPFVEEIVRILGLLPQDGLVIDVRGNGGGVIPSGEQLLQLFTPRTIEPERLHFINSELTLRLVETVLALERWAPSIAEAVETGAVYSDGLPIATSTVDDCNRIGQRYYGPVVLVVDALCYSTTDIFAAGFQDHEIGPVLGTHGATGAGGANVWTHAQVQQMLSGHGVLEELPRGTSLRVATRRTTRVGARAGDTLEDLGVVPDEFHELTYRDIMEQNPDLIERAAALLADMPPCSFAAQPGTASAGSVAIKATTRGVTRIDAYVDARPRGSFDVEDGEIELKLPVTPGRRASVELQGYDGARYAALLRFYVEAGDG